MLEPAEPCLAECEDCEGTGAVVDDNGCPPEGTVCACCAGSGERLFDGDDASSWIETLARADALEGR